MCEPESAVLLMQTSSQSSKSSGSITPCKFVGMIGVKSKITPLWEDYYHKIADILLFSFLYIGLHIVINS